MLNSGLNLKIVKMAAMAEKWTVMGILLTGSSVSYTVLGEVLLWGGVKISG